MLTIPLGVNAAGYTCDKVESQGEGHWPLPEEAFNKERFEKALKALKNISETDAKASDYINVEHELMYIEGYMLKIHDERYDFCKFLKEEAYVRH